MQAVEALLSATKVRYYNIGQTITENKIVIEQNNTEVLSYKTAKLKEKWSSKNR